MRKEEQIDNGVNKSHLSLYETKSSKKIYIGYQARVCINCSLLIILLFVTAIFIKNTIILEPTKMISYQEKGDIDYKVFLKQNNFYDKEYLDKDMVYIASLIDTISIDFLYQFYVDEQVSLSFNYDIVANLLIQDVLEKNTYFEKEYVLLNNKNFRMDDINQYNINENINVDYSYYNTLSNKFKTVYGVDAKSNLIIYLRINKSNDEGIFNNDSVMSIKIPLSEKDVNIKMDYTKLTEDSKTVRNKNLAFKNIFYIMGTIISIIFTIISFINLVKLMKLSKKTRSKYDKYVNKILKTYDRVIAEVYTAPKLKSNNIIKVKKFEELLDIRDNLNLPIMYYCVTKHQKSYFYIIHHEEIYLLVIKAIDLDCNYEK